MLFCMRILNMFDPNLWYQSKANEQRLTLIGIGFISSIHLTFDNLLKLTENPIIIND